jgi:hypothetical protein
MTINFAPYFLITYVVMIRLIDLHPIIIIILHKMSAAYVRGKVDVPVTTGNYADELLARIWEHAINTPDRPAFVNIVSLVTNR